MFFKQEALNPSNKIYFIKTVRYKLYYVIDGFTTIAIANLISLYNIGPRVKSHFQFSLLTILWSCRKKITHVTDYNCRDLSQQNRKLRLYITAFTGGSVY